MPVATAMALTVDAHAPSDAPPPSLPPSPPLEVDQNPLQQPPTIVLDEKREPPGLRRRTSKEKMIDTAKAIGRALSSGGAPPAFMD